MIQRIEYAVIRLISFLIQLLPLSVALWLAKPLGYLLCMLLSKSRRMALENLKAAFPEKSESEINQIAHGTFRHLAEFGIEWLLMPKIIHNPEQYLVTVHRGNEVQNAIKRGSGAIVLVCHIGNSEIMALMGGKLVAQPIGAKVYAVARPLKNPHVYDYAMKLRSGFGLETIDKSGGVQGMLNALKSNSIVCILIDQRVSEGSIEVDFFGRPALTTSLPAIAAMRLGTPVFFNFLDRKNDRYEMRVEGPIEITKTGNVKEDIRTNTQKFITRIEEEIRKNPTHWLWMHNRWRPEHGKKD